MNKLIYLADDDNEILELLKAFLLSESYEVETFLTGDSLYDNFQKNPCDLIVLDIMMPGSSGLEICKKIRDISTVPVILLTAKDTDVDYITGITYGSDDYIIKPFKPTLLMARIKALFRRIEMEQKVRENKEDDIRVSDLSYDSKKHEIFCDSSSLKLTPNELDILLYMMKNYESAIKRESFFEVIWGTNEDVESRVVDETVRKIRKKLSLAQSASTIKTVWGFGYKLE